MQIREYVVSGLESSVCSKSCGSSEVLGFAKNVPTTDVRFS